MVQLQLTIPGDTGGNLDSNNSAKVFFHIFCGTAAQDGDTGGNFVLSAVQMYDLNHAHSIVNFL